MKKNQLTSLWRAIVLLTAVFFFFACKPSGNNDPTDPASLPVVHIGAATNVTSTAASIIAWVTPNGSNTAISFEYKNSTEATYHVKALGTTYSGKDSIKVTFDFSDLVANSEYSIRVRVTNKAGEVLSGNSEFTTYIVKDYDGNSYHVVRIGNQLWLQENLKTTHYANGDAIETQPIRYWTDHTASYYCYYNNDQATGNVYGALYNWNAANDTRGFIVGYHLPSAVEFTTLQSYLGGAPLSALKLIEGGYTHWVDLGLKGTINSSGFTALGAGIVFTGLGTGPIFSGIKSMTCFQSSTNWKENGFFTSFFIQPGYDVSSGGDATLGGSLKTDGNSIRLLKN